jgi:ubiquitin-like 1-activating enzyme E1 B
LGQVAYTNIYSEMFGASEDDSPELDHSEDSENGRFWRRLHALWIVALTIPAAQEIEKLRQEAQALKQIRESMGTDSFPRLLFDKVFKDDIERLKSMEEMWKTRKPPQSLDYGSTIEEVGNAELKKSEILKADQRAWDLHENIVVFKDR